MKSQIWVCRETLRLKKYCLNINFYRVDRYHFNNNSKNPPDDAIRHLYSGQPSKTSVEILLNIKGSREFLTGQIPVTKESSNCLFHSLEINKLKGFVDRY